MLNAVDFLLEKQRMCDSIRHVGTLCGECELHKEKCCYTHKTKEQAKKAVEIVERWSKEHPRKTRASEFLKSYPNAATDVIDGFPCMNPCSLDSTLHNRSRCNELGCADCRREYWTEALE